MLTYVKASVKQTIRDQHSLGTDTKCSQLFFDSLSKETLQAFNSQRCAVDDLFHDFANGSYYDYIVIKVFLVDKFKNLLFLTI